MSCLESGLDYRYHRVAMAGWWILILVTPATRNPGIPSEVYPKINGRYLEIISLTQSP